MNNPFYMLVAAAGLTHLLTHSYLLEPARNQLRAALPGRVAHVVDCPQCVGFWAGLLCGGLSGAGAGRGGLGRLLMAGAAGSLAAVAWDITQALVDAKTFTHTPDPEDDVA